MKIKKEKKVLNSQVISGTAVASPQTVLLQDFTRNRQMCKQHMPHILLTRIISTVSENFKCNRG